MRRGGRALRLGPDTHGELLLMLPTMCALRSGRVNRYWREQVGRLFRVGGELSEVGRARLLRAAARGDDPEPDVGAACAMAAAIRSSFVLRICPGTMYSRPSPGGLDFLCRAVPFGVIGRTRRAVWRNSRDSRRPGSRRGWRGRPPCCAARAHPDREARFHDANIRNYLRHRAAPTLLSQTPSTEPRPGCDSLSVSTSSRQPNSPQQPVPCVLDVAGLRA